jgi:hypothetical protein
MFLPPPSTLPAHNSSIQYSTRKGRAKEGGKEKKKELKK